MQKITFQLPVPRYLKKILEIKYGNEYQAKETTLFGMVVINTLQKKSDRKYTFDKMQSQNDYFSITLGMDKAQRNGFQHGQKRAFQLSHLIERNIREELYNTCIFNQINYGIEFQTTILDFIAMYDITEEELSYETLRKDFNRYKLKNLHKFK